MEYYSISNFLNLCCLPVEIRVTWLINYFCLNSLRDASRTSHCVALPLFCFPRLLAPTSPEDSGSGRQDEGWLAGAGKDSPVYCVSFHCCVREGE